MLYLDSDNICKSLIDLVHTGTYQITLYFILYLIIEMSSISLKTKLVKKIG